MKLLLDTITIEPASGEKPQNAIVLLHGFGGSGKDISMLTINWKRFLPDTVFLCPNAHQECSISPSGYQWFDLSKDDNESIFKSSLLAEKKINEYISQIKNIYELKNKWNFLTLSTLAVHQHQLTQLFENRFRRRPPRYKAPVATPQTAPVPLGNYAEPRDS